MESAFAQIISFLTEPAGLLIATVFLLVYNANFTDALSGLIFLVVGGLVPLILSLYDYIKSRNGDIDPTQRLRTPIFLVAVFGFVINTVIFGSAIFPNAFWANFSMVTAIFFAVAYLINKYFDKFSLHMAMFSFCTMVLLDKVNMAFALLFILTPLIIWSRVSLRKHTWLQLLWGWALGLAVGLLVWML